MKNEQRKMKNSGIEWIGEIPSDWKLVKVKHLFVIGRGRVIPTTELIDDGKYPVYSSQTVNDGCMGYINTYDFDGDFLTWTTDGAYAGSVFKRSGKFNCTNVCGTLKCKVIDVDIDYLWYALDYCSNYNKRTDINGAKIMNNEMAKIVIALPDYEYQKKVSNYLNDKCKNINRLIKIEEQQIEKLKEYKQSLITEVVTKGLEKNIKMKDSGVEWIGKIPKDWQVIKLKYIATEILKGKGITKDEVIEDGEVFCVRYGEIYSKYDTSFDNCISKTSLNRIENPVYFEKGNILFAGTGELIDEIGKNILYTGESKCLAGGDIIILKHNLDPKFLNYALNSIYVQKQKSRGKMKLKVVHISATEIGNLLVVLPKIEEQVRISEHLDDKCTGINKIISLKKIKIEKLNEYKKSLIYEYVTGKKEV